ncbi:MAG: ParB N-terminal domain-containing protein [Candidatus Dormibacteria bacterium]
MSALAATPEPTLEPGGTARFPIGKLEVGPSLRERGIDPAHVAALAEVAESWPPIIVNRADRMVIDGQHRVAAAKQLGLRDVNVTWFDGSREQSYLEFVRSNVRHGLPLTLAERRRAARRVVCSCPDLSDRGIATACGLSPRTVARLREEASADTVRSHASRRDQRRVGRDGRVRPIDPRTTRARIAEELSRRPDASLRTIAAAVGASPETVRSVRNELRGRGSTTRLGAAEPDAAAKVLGLLSRSAGAHVGVTCRGDRAFTDRDDGPDFVEWFGATSVEQGDLWRYVQAVPLSRVYEIADEARRRAEFWSGFAGAVEDRVRRRA